MNKPIFYLVLVVCFFSFYAVGYFSTSPEEAAQAPQVSAVPLQKQSLNVVQTRSGSDPSAPVKPKGVLEAVAAEKGARLFNTLFAGASFPPFSQLQGSLEKRFTLPYPSDERSEQQEIVSRLGILKAMDKEYQNAVPKAEQPQLLEFYSELAANVDENPVVRRQAGRNLVAWASRLDEAKRLELFGNAGRFLASAGKSEAELLEEIFHNGY